MREYQSDQGAALQTGRGPGGRPARWRRRTATSTTSQSARPPMTEQRAAASGGQGVPVGAEYLVCRAIDPKRGAVDFAMCRVDGPSSDNRRPDFVTNGTIMDDLARRDFTMNAIARDIVTGEILDLFNGQEDIHHRIIRFVGDPSTRIEEDALRIMRMLRFMVTLNFKIDFEAFKMLDTLRTADLLATVSIERIMAEVRKMMNADTQRTVAVLASLSKEMKTAIFRGNTMKLNPTNKTTLR